MNRAFRTLVLAVAVSLPLATATGSARGAEPPAKVPTELQGTWKLVSVEVNGKTLEPLGGQARVVIKGDKMLYGGAELAGLTVDAAASPRVIDLKFRDPERVYEGIYSVEKGTLKVCLNRQTEGAKDRPAAFSTKDQEDWRLLVFEQEKDAKGDGMEGVSGFVGLALKLDEDNKEVIVASTLKDSPAEQAGFKKDDVVMKVATVEVTDLPSAITTVQKTKPGEKLEFRIRRGKEESTITVKVGVLPFPFVARLG